MKRLAGFLPKRVWVVVSLMISSSVYFAESGAGHLSASRGQGQVSLPPEIRPGIGWLYFPFSVQTIPYPDVLWLYPCFPLVSCTELHAYRRYERREKRQQPRAVPGPPLVNEAMEAWRAGLRPAAEPFRTDERQIVPALRDHSLVRPQYQKSGTLLPHFATDKK